MGKGDRRTKRGKIYRGTHGNSRSRKKEKARKKRAQSRSAEPQDPGAAR
ncbi:MAG: 30S ribosomal protein THX [Gemmatimonadetes bacterium]|nr:MAG: 30S ribosomal protein THX [Gemmatimonadota bacterium]